MREIHCVPCKTEDGIVDVYAQYEAPDGYDLWQGIHNAMVDYCMEKYNECSRSHMASLNYDEFIQSVPNEICQRHGFSKTVLNNCASLYGADEIRIGIPEMRLIIALFDERFDLQTAERSAMKNRESIRQAVFCQFAEKAAKSMNRFNSRFSGFSTESIMIEMYDWAREYAESEGASINDVEGINNFYKRKADRLTRN